MSDPISQQVLDRLAQFDTPTICNVIELFAVRPQTAGYMDGRIRAGFPEMKPMVGYAATATFRSADPPRGQSAYTALEEQLAGFATLPGPAVVVFQDLDDPPAAATFGEVMCTTYKAFGACGLITSGAGRDLDQVRAIDFPVFTGSTICSHGYPQITSSMQPVHVGGVTIHPGDLLHGDVNGITTIPSDIAAHVADLCQPFMDAEAIVLDYVRRDGATVDGFKKKMAELRDALGALKKEAQQRIV